MSLGQNLQFLRKMYHGMTQEELAEKMGVSRQTVSKWELDAAYPEMEKVVELCKLFSCSMDHLVRENINTCNEAYSDIRIEEVEAFQYVQYAVISKEPEHDAIKHIKEWAVSHNIAKPEIIGWDFPHVSQEQINVFHMHGYAAACILPSDSAFDHVEVVSQKNQKYAIITIKDPFNNEAFALIENAYKTLILYMQVNGIKHKHTKEVLSCFEKEYVIDGIIYMDVHIAADL